VIPVSAKSPRSYWTRSLPNKMKSSHFPWNGIQTTSGRTVKIYEAAANACWRFSILPDTRSTVVSEYNYSASDRGAEYCDVCLCACVGLSAIMSSELHLRSPSNCLCPLPMVVTRSSSGGIVICYVFYG